MAERFVDTIKCVSCDFRASGETELLAHVKIHLHEKNFRLKCLFCPQTFKNEHSYQKHKKNCLAKIQVKKNIEKKEFKDTTAENEQFWVCEILFCDEKRQIFGKPDSKDFNEVVKHLNRHVRNATTVCCPIAICGKKFSTYKGLWQHTNWHKLKEVYSIKINVNSAPLETENSIEALEDATSHAEIVANEVLNTSVTESIQESRTAFVEESNEAVQAPIVAGSPKISIFDIEKMEGMFALKLMAEHMLPEQGQIFL